MLIQNVLIVEEAGFWADYLYALGQNVTKPCELLKQNEIVQSLHDFFGACNLSIIKVVSFPHPK